MFDSVGKDLDEEAGKRRAQSLGILLLLAFIVVGTVVLAGMWTVTEMVLEEVTGEEISLIEMIEESIEPEAAPPPPPPPPPPPSAAPEEEEEEEDEPDDPEPDEMVEEVTELDKKIEEDIKDADKPKGQEGGVEGGVEGGEVGGVLGGVEGGVIGGKLGSGGPKVFHHSQLEIKRKVEPRYPSAAKGLGLGDQRCRTKVRIDDKGVPYQVDVTGCPNVFHGEVREAILRWRWYPARDGREKISVQTTIMIVFKETG